MRNFQLLDTFKLDGQIVRLSQSDPDAGNAHVVMVREGERIAISVNIGPLELAIRPHFEEMRRHIAALKPVPGLTSTRQVGSSQAYMGLGLSEENQLVMRPILLTDATGHVGINLIVSKEATEQLKNWLNG